MVSAQSKSKRQSRILELWNLDGFSFGSCGTRPSGTAALPRPADPQARTASPDTIRVQRERRSSLEFVSQRSCGDVLRAGPFHLFRLAPSRYCGVLLRASVRLRTSVVHGFSLSYRSCGRRFDRHRGRIPGPDRVVQKSYYAAATAIRGTIARYILCGLFYCNVSNRDHICIISLFRPILRGIGGGRLVAHSRYRSLRSYERLFFHSWNTFLSFPKSAEHQAEYGRCSCVRRMDESQKRYRGNLVCGRIACAVWNQCHRR